MKLYAVCYTHKHTHTHIHTGEMHFTHSPVQRSDNPRPAFYLRPICSNLLTCPFYYAPQLVPAGTAEARISYGNSVCGSVTTRWYTKLRWDRDSGSSPYGSLETGVSSFLWGNLVPMGEEILLERGHQRGVPPLWNRYSTTIGSSSMKTVADRHRLAAYHNKHCRGAFQWYQHR